MQTELTANRVRGTAIGAMIAAGFGMGWLFWSLAAMHKIAAGSAIGVELGAVALLAPAIYAARQAKRWPRADGDPAMMRRFAWINAFQWAAIVAALLGLSRLHLYAYDAAAITAIVGLHYLPLARLFLFPMHYATGVVLVCWSGISALLFSQNAVLSAAAMGTGVILWASAAAMLVLVMRWMAVSTAAGELG